MGFELFKHTRAYTRYSEPTVTIYCSGIFCLSSEATRLLSSDLSNKDIEIYRDTDGGMLGIKPECGTRRLTCNKKQSSSRFSCRELQKQIATTGRFESYWSDEDNMLIIDLNKPIK